MTDLNFMVFFGKGVSFAIHAFKWSNLDPYLPYAWSF
jgi:hypothetical protein